MAYESYTPKGTIPDYLCDEEGNKTRRQSCEQQEYHNPDATALTNEQIEKSRVMAAKYLAKKSR